MAIKAGDQSVAVALVVREIEHQRAVLVVKRSKKDGKCPSWVFPGGKVNKGESASAAAIRELREETGVVAEGPSIIGERRHPVSGVRIFYVAFRAIAGSELVLEDHKIEDAEWIPTSDIQERLGTTLYPKVFNYLKNQQILDPPL